MAELGKVALYLCGGTGGNIGAQFVEMPSDSSKGFAPITTHFIDTSRSNLSESIPEDNIFIVKGTTDRDGSGMKRDENYIAIREAIPAILLKHRPQDLNIVMFSVAGGTGSIAGPLLARELLHRGHPTVVIAIGSIESLKAATNTLAALESLDGAANGLGVPLPIFYRQNVGGRPQSDIDNECIHTVVMLSLLAGRQINGVDVSDVFNFLNYHRVTDVRPGVASLEYFTSDSDALVSKRPVSMISVYENKDAPRIAVTPDYLVTGYMNINLNGSKQCHYIIDVDAPGQWHHSAKQAVNTLKEASAARPKQARMASDSGVDEFGMKF